MKPDSDHEVREWLTRLIPALPLDLVITLVIVASTAFAILVSPVSETPIRAFLAVLYVLFAPGYAFIAALFPKSRVEVDILEEVDSRDQDRPQTSDPNWPTYNLPNRERRVVNGSISNLERLVLTLGMSVVIVALIGVVLNAVKQINLVFLFLMSATFTIIMTGIAYQRRRALDPGSRFRVPYQRWVSDGYTALFGRENNVELVVNVVLIGSIILLIISMTLLIAVPRPGESFTEFYVLTENDTGNLVADDYPTEFQVGGSESLYVGIGNKEHRQMGYTIVVQLQRVQTANNTTQVLEKQEIGRLTATVSDNESRVKEVIVSPTLTGDGLRLVFMLYRSEPPMTPSIENSYQDLHIWVNVSEQPGADVPVLDSERDGGMSLELRSA